MEQRVNYFSVEQVWNAGYPARGPLLEILDSLLLYDMETELKLTMVVNAFADTSYSMLNALHNLIYDISGEVWVYKDEQVHQVWYMMHSFVQTLTNYKIVDVELTSHLLRGIEK